MALMWCASCVTCSPTSPAGCSSSGTAHPSTARVVKDFLATGAAARLHLERLPGYAPDLNPDEGVWRHLKRVELRNVCCRDLAHLRTELARAAKRLRHRPHILRGCIRHAGYDL